MENKRIAQINIRMTPAERVKVESAARVEDRQLTDWARRALLKAADLRRKRRAV
jgi:uncharacterized protein (DUF1778 family)